MALLKEDIIAKLKKDILAIQGFGPLLNNVQLDKKIGIIKYAFPGNSFPVGCMHEFICEREKTASTIGFIAAITTSLIRKGGVLCWIGSNGTIFPPALKSFGIEPEHVIFIDHLKKEQLLWAMEEALKCRSFGAVICHVPDLSFNISRRLQLAVEQSRVTGFIIRCDPKIMINNACVARWKITSMASSFESDMPGIGYPRWNIELLKVRNGKPGEWKVEYSKGRLSQVYKEIMTREHKQTG